MIFSSLEFLCVFLPVCFLLYCIMPGRKSKNAWLILMSLIFYAYGEPVYVFLMIFSALFNYVCARRIASAKNGGKPLLIICVLVNLASLGFFKYTVFLIESLNQAAGLAIAVPKIVLPVGISFFTFQALSYVIDVYYKRVEVQNSFWKVLLYISFFPQLIAGPIVKYRDISEAIDNRKMDLDEVAAGLRRFICGLGKKVLIANAAGQAADLVFGAEAGQVNCISAWIGAVAYLLQIYYDFSGYSDMAIGLGKMFGFSFKENFQYPYGADSIQEFWRRWHISLSGWFKEYLYIPLGGNRKGRFRTCVNKIIVFFCTGLWHGANWTFVIWGLYHGFFLLLEEYIPLIRKLPKCIRRIYAMLVVCIGFVMFRADTVSQGIYMIGQMFTGTEFTSGNISFMWQLLTPWFIVMAVIGIIGAAPIRPLADRIRAAFAKDLPEFLPGWRLVQRLLYILSFVLLLWCMIRLSGTTYNPFIYFRF